MGFECGFDIIEKYKDTTIEEFDNIKTYLSWKRNEWNFEINPNTGKAPYPTYKEYWLNFFYDNEEANYPGEPDLDKLNYYNNLPKDSFGSNLTTLASFCSTGKYIDNYIISSLKKINNEELWIGIDNEWVSNALVWVDEQLESCKLIPVTVRYALKLNTDDTITLIPCDGIEVEDEEGNIKRIYNEYEYIYAASKDFDDDKLYVLETFKEMLLTLKHINLDNYLIWYWRSY